MATRLNPAPPTRGAFPRFIAWGKAILDKHQRSEQQGILEIQHRIISGREQVPGFEDWTKATLPPGCSAANLRKVLARTKAEKQQGKWGSRAAAAVLPYVRTSRVGLPVGGQYMFDDVWHDHYVTFAGKPVRVLNSALMTLRPAAGLTGGTCPL